MKNSSEQQAFRDRRKYLKHNELTNMTILMPGLVKNYCEVQDVKSETGFVERAFADDHLNRLVRVRSLDCMSSPTLAIDSFKNGGNLTTSQLVRTRSGNKDI